MEDKERRGEEVTEVDPELFRKYMEASDALEAEMIAEMGQERYDASQHWMNNPLISPISKVDAYEKALKREGDEAYGEGIAWERKRVEMAWFLEMDCQCEDAMGHLKRRIDGDIRSE